MCRKIFSSKCQPFNKERCTVPSLMSNTVLGTKNSVNETQSDLQGAQVFGKVTKQMTRKGISVRGFCGRELLELTQLNCFKGRSLEHRQSKVIENITVLDSALL